MIQRLLCYLGFHRNRIIAISGDGAAMYRCERCGKVMWT